MTNRSSRAARWPIRLVAGVTLLNGLWSILRVLVVRVPEYPRLATWILPFGLYQWRRSLTLAFGFLLAYLSVNLYQRKRVAWWIATVVALLTIALHVTHRQLWYTAFAPAITASLLIAFRRRFTVRSETTSIIQGIGLVAVSLGVALMYGTAGFWFLDRRDFGVDFRLADALMRTLREFALLGNDDLIPQTRHARWFLESLGLFGFIALVFAAYSLFRPVAYRLRTVAHERRDAAALIERYGRTSLDFLKLWRDKSYFFSPDRECVIAYRTVWGVALALGDPVGREDRIAPTTEQFVQYSTDNGWEVAFVQTLGTFIPLYETLGFQAIKIGEEAIVNLDAFSDRLADRGNFGRVRRKLEREGYRYGRERPPHSSRLLDELRIVSDEWLRLPGRRERSFTLGRFDPGYLNETDVYLVRDPKGRVIAFANGIPACGTGSPSIDLMRHRTDIPNGAMDYLFTSLLLDLRADGHRTFDLGLAPLSGVGDRPGATFGEQALHLVYEHLNRFFAYKGLRNYKSKFQPSWEDRFLVYRGGPPGLVRTTLALIQATEG